MGPRIATWFAVEYCLESGANGYFGFTETHVSANEAIHGVGFFHVSLGRFNGFHLVGGFLVRKGRFKLALPLVVHSERVALLGVPFRPGF